MAANRKKVPLSVSVLANNVRFRNAYLGPHLWVERTEAQWKRTHISWTLRTAWLRDTLAHTRGFGGVGNGTERSDVCSTQAIRPRPAPSERATANRILLPCRTKRNPPPTPRRAREHTQKRPAVKRDDMECHCSAAPVRVQAMPDLGVTANLVKSWIPWNHGHQYASRHCSPISMSLTNQERGMNHIQER